MTKYLFSRPPCLIGEKTRDAMLLCERQPARVDIAQCSDLPVTLVFLPAHDIAMFVGEGDVDIGITGLDVVKETSDDSEIEVAMVRELERNWKKRCFTSVR